MNLLFSINRAFVPLLLNCLKSVVKNGGEAHYDAYILHSDLTQADQTAIASGAGERVTIHFIPIRRELFADLPVTKRYPQQIYYRIAAPLLLPGDIHRILYLDVDTVIINPLRELYDMDFEGNFYIACTHTRRFLTELNLARLGAPKDGVYVNTGVMVLNLDALRENLSLEDVQSYARERMKTFILPDQDIITGLYGDRIKAVDTRKYNLSDRILAFYNADPGNEKMDLDWVRKNTVVIHYCGRNKPWTEGYHGILGVFYEELQEGGSPRG